MQEIGTAAKSPLPSDFPGLRVLLVEDNLINRKVMGRYCEKLGCDVTLAENGREAFACLQDERFDIVLTDIHMPDMDGMELATAVRSVQEEWRGVPLIAVTSSSDPDDYALYLTAGIDDFLAKPFDVSQLRQLLSRYTEHPTEAATRKPSAPAAKEDVALDSLPVFDEETARHYTIQNETFLRKLLTEYISTSAEQLQLMDEAVAQERFDQLQQLAHRAKGASGVVAAQQVQELCKRLERACQGGYVERALEMHRLLGDAYTRFQQYLKTHGFLDVSP